VGTLEACLLAQRGFNVDLYEYRQDIRTMEHVPGRSINLAMSVRGRSAMRQVGLEEDVVRNHGIPMYARMIHDVSGQTREIPYNREGKCIYSVGRRYVNEILLTKAESFSNVTCHFEHRLADVNLDTATMTFANPDGEGTFTRKADVLIGCDGAYSAVRKKMLKRPHFNYNQTYIPHGYMELCIPATDKGEFAMPPNYLHIWPRGQFMMIALPNQDKSWTVTLFMPFDIFDAITTPEKLLDFFKTTYADSIPLIGEERLVEDFFRNKRLPMISVKCSPYHIGTSSLIMGDAAHAMVPFYGQGMNCGMEDCLVLNELLDEFGNDLSLALPAYSVTRNPDAEAIVDLAMYNYVEMRDHVNTRAYLFRKKVDNLLNVLLPKTWVPLYSMVTFSREPYHKCIEKKEWQDKTLGRVYLVSGAAGLVGGAFLLVRYPQLLASLQGHAQALMGCIRLPSVL